MLGAAAPTTTNLVPALGPIPNLSGRTPVAFVMGAGATMIDFAGPWEVFQDLPDTVPSCYPYTVSDTTDELSTGSGSVNGRICGLRFRPDYTFADAPQPKVIVMGAQLGHTPTKIDWIRRAAEKAEFVLSVCTGAFLLAKTGLLDGLEATTHHEFFDQFQHQFPKIKLVRDARYIDNGRVISAGG
ncbi:MAG: DJ-1/PfpI family protein, partial [Sphingomonas sp.]